MNLPTIDSLPNFGGTLNMNFGEYRVRCIVPIPSAVLYADKKRTSSEAAKKGSPITLARQRRSYQLTKQLMIDTLTFKKCTGATKLARFQRPQTVGVFAYLSRFFRPLFK